MPMEDAKKRQSMTGAERRKHKRKQKEDNIVITVFI